MRPMAAVLAFAKLVRRWFQSLEFLVLPVLLLILLIVWLSSSVHVVLFELMVSPDDDEAEVGSNDNLLSSDSGGIEINFWKYFKRYLSRFTNEQIIAKIVAGK